MRGVKTVDCHAPNHTGFRARNGKQAFYFEFRPPLPDGRQVPKSMPAKVGQAGATRCVVLVLGPAPRGVQGQARRTRGEVKLTPNPIAKERK